MPAPSFYQRNVAQQLQGSTDEQIRKAYETWKQSRGSSAASGATPAEPTSGGTPTYEQLPGLKTSPVRITPTETTAGSTPASPVAPSIVTTTSTPQTSPAAPGMVPATDAAATVRRTELNRPRYPIRQPELDALFDGDVPPEILNSVLTAPAVEPVRMPQPVAQTAAVAEPNISFSRRSNSVTVPVDIGTKQEGPPPTFAPPEKETPGVGARAYNPPPAWMPSHQTGGKVS